MQNYLLFGPCLLKLCANWRQGGPRTGQDQYDVKPCNLPLFIWRCPYIWGYLYPYILGESLFIGRCGLFVWISHKFSGELLTFRGQNLHNSPGFQPDLSQICAFLRLPFLGQNNNRKWASTLIFKGCTYNKGYLISVDIRVYLFIRAAFIFQVFPDCNWGYPSMPSAIVVLSVAIHSMCKLCTLIIDMSIMRTQFPHRVVHN